MNTNKSGWVYYEAFIAVPLNMDTGVWGLMKDDNMFGTLILYPEPKIKAKEISFSDFLTLIELIKEVFNNQVSQPVC